MRRKGTSWSCYLVRCRDGSLYTGIAKDVIVRVAQHNAKRGAKYTRSRVPVTLVFSQRFVTHRGAAQAEARIKGLTKPERERIVASGMLPALGKIRYPSQMKTPHKPTTVTGYIAAFPPQTRTMLRQLRSIIRAVAPSAEEKLSYGMPYYHLSGRLTYFAGFKNHVSFFVMGRAQKTFAVEQRPYRTGRATLQFPIGSKLPVALIRKLLRVRIAELRTASSRQIVD